MIDPGNRFSVPYEDVIQDLEDRIRYGVEQPDRARFTFRAQVSSYELPREAYAISRITGRMGNTFTEFQLGEHYRFSNNRIFWVHSDERPDENSRLEVEFTYRERPAGLTDFNPGSVTATLVRAVAREIKLLYDQMDQAYRRAFIDIATGVALNNVVALLGVTRNLNTRAIGHVTFLRNTPTESDITIPPGTRLADESERIFVTTEEATLVGVALEIAAAAQDRVKVTNKVAALIGIWRKDDDLQADSPPVPLATRETPGLQIAGGERTLILPAGSLPAGELKVRYHPRSVTVPIRAEAAGPDGNVNAGSIVIMPTPPPGVNGVTNEAPTAGGLVDETDDQLRERAKHALERSGNATMNAIKYSVLGIPGVEEVEVVDGQGDSTIPLGEVRVRVFGGDLRQVIDTIERTRSAGIRAVPEVIETVLISGTFFVIPDVSVPSAATAEFRSAVIEQIKTQGIGQSLSLRRLNSFAYGISGLADVAEAQLTSRGTSPGNVVTDPLLIEATQLIRPDPENLTATLLDSLAAQRQPDTRLGIELWLVDVAGNRISFDNFSLDIMVTLNAASIIALDQPPERVGRFTTTVQFTNTATAVMTLDPTTHAPQFDAERHNPDVEVSVNAAAYPGLKVANIVTVDFSNEG